MPKIYSATKVIKILQKNDFSKVSQHGSHIKLVKSGEKVLTVIVPNHKEIAVGTFNSILKQAGMSKKEFEALN